VRSEYRGSSGRLTLFVGNKHTAPLTRLRFDVQQVAGLRVTLSDLPSSVADRQQITLAAAVHCSAPFASPPSLSVAYTLDSSEVSFLVKLPLFVTKFLAPSPTMEKSRFYDLWRSLTGHQKLESVLLAKADLAGLRGWHDLFSSLRLAVLPDVDPNPLNLFASSTLNTEGGAAELVIVRLESSATSSAQYRLTVASLSPQLALAVRSCVQPLAEA